MTKDSSYIDKYISGDNWELSPDSYWDLQKQKPSPLPDGKKYKTTEVAIIDDKNLKKKKGEGSIS